MYTRAERLATGADRLRAALGVAASALRLGEFVLAYEKACARLRSS
jgi:hypothetical protein